MHKSSASVILPLVAALAASSATAQQPIAFGNIVVMRVGDGTAALGSTATPMFLDEYTPAGVLAQTIALPTAASGLNRPIGVRGTATSEGFLNISANGLYLLATGYDVTPGATGFATAAAATVNRVIARVDFLGNVDTTTALTDAYSAGNPRCVVSDDGNQFWISGTAVSDGGVRYVANVGDTTCLGLNAGAPTNCRNIGIFDGQLYITSSSGNFHGVCTVGDGLPTGSGQPITVLPGFPTALTAANESTYDFFFADPFTVYAADDRTGAAPEDGGIQKWTFDGLTWTKQYTFKLSATAAASGARGVTGHVVDGVTTLWATDTATASNLVTITDTGPSSAVTVLVPGTTNTSLRGVRYYPKPSTLTRLIGGCGQADIKAFGNGEIGTDVRTKLVNTQVIPIIGYGTQALSFPLCTGCTLLHDFAFIVVGDQHTLSLPNSPGLIGVSILIQGIDFIAPGGCTSPLFMTLTDGYALTLQ